MTSNQNTLDKRNNSPIDAPRLLRLFNKEQLRRSYASRDLRVNGMPRHLWIEPTNACNAHCPLCPTGAGQLARPKAQMTFKLFKAIVDEAHPFVSTMNLWNMGEPFLNRRLFDMIAYAHQHRIATTVSTNGFVFYKPENAARLISCGLDTLLVGLDGATAEVFNEYRVNVDFAKALQGLRLLVAEKQLRQVDHPRVIWQFIAMKHNEHQIEGARQQAQELGIEFALKTVNVEMLVDPVEAVEYLPQDEKLRRYNHGGNGDLVFRGERTNTCPILWSSLMVNADGEVVPCCYDYESDLVLGHFPTQSLAEIWNGAPLQNLRKRIQRERMELRPCSKCAVGSSNVLFVEQ